MPTSYPHVLLASSPSYASLSIVPCRFTCSYPSTTHFPLPFELLLSPPIHYLHMLLVCQCFPPLYCFFTYFSSLLLPVPLLLILFTHHQSLRPFCNYPLYPFPTFISSQFASLSSPFLSFYVYVITVPFRAMQLFLLIYHPFLRYLFNYYTHHPFPTFIFS